MKKKIYEVPNVEIVEFETEEIMVVSGVASLTDWNADGVWGSEKDW